MLLSIYCAHRRLLGRIENKKNTFSLLDIFFFYFNRNSNVSGERSPFDGSCCSGQGVAGDSSESDVEEFPKYRVVLLGDSGVGKTALVSQFMTSEYMNTYDASLGKLQSLR